MKQLPRSGRVCIKLDAPQILCLQTLWGGQRVVLENGHSAEHSGQILSFAREDATALCYEIERRARGPLARTNAIRIARSVINEISRLEVH